MRAFHCAPRALSCQSQLPSLLLLRWGLVIAAADARGVPSGPRLVRLRFCRRALAGSGGGSSPPWSSVGSTCASVGRLIWSINARISSGRIGTPLNTPSSSAAHRKIVRNLFLRDMTLLPARPGRADRFHNPTWELRERGVPRGAARLDHREKRQRSLVATGGLSWYDRCRGRREKDEDRGDDQPLERDAAERQHCREHDQGDTCDGERLAGSWHFSPILAA